MNALRVEPREDGPVEVAHLGEQFEVVKGVGEVTVGEHDLP
jgi:hypothetical protein